MKSVLHIALIAPGGYSNKPFIKAFFDNGFFEYHCFDFQEKTFNSDRETMRRMLIQEAECLKPDLIFSQIQGSDILDLQTFQTLSQISFTVNYTFDIRTPEQTEWLYNLCPVLGLICFSNQRDVDECKRRGYDNVMVLQSSADPDVYKPDESIERKGIVFIGNNFENTNHQFPLSQERREMVEFLQKEFPDQFKVYGNNFGITKLINQKEEIEILQSAAIVIGQNNFDAELYCSDRIWRTMMCGAFCLTKHFGGVEKLFDKDQLGWWRDLNSLKENIKYYLEKPNRTALRAEAGRQHVLVNHTWAARIKGMMTFIQTLNIPVIVDRDACLKAGAHVIDGIIPGPLDEHLNNRACDCGKIKYLWQECGCTLKEWQLRAQQNI